MDCRRQPRDCERRSDRNRRRWKLREASAQLRRDASRRLRRQGATEVHGPDGYLGDGDVPKRRWVRGSTISEARRPRADVDLRADLQRLAERVGFCGFAPPVADYLNSILGRGGGGQRGTPLRRDGPQRNFVHRGATVLWLAPSRRRALESLMGNSLRARSANQFPYWFGRHDRRFVERSYGRVWQNGGVHRAGGRHLSAQRLATE